MNSWLARNFVYRPATWLRGEPVFRLIREYERTQWRSPEEIVADQARKLREILRYAATRSPFYADRARSAGLSPDTLEASDLDRFEPITKTDLVERRAEIDVARLVTQKKRRPGVSTEW